jgi:hypothetical protein
MDKPQGNNTDRAVYLGSQCIDLLCCCLSHDGLILPDRRQMTELPPGEGDQSKTYFTSIAASATKSMVELMQQLTKKKALSETAKRSALHKRYQGLVMPDKNTLASRFVRILGDVYRTADGIKNESVSARAFEALALLVNESDDGCIEFLMCTPNVMNVETGNALKRLEDLVRNKREPDTIEKLLDKRALFALRRVLSLEQAEQAGQTYRDFQVRILQIIRLFVSKDLPVGVRTKILEQDKKRYDGTLYSPGEKKTDRTLVQVVSEVLKSDEYVSMMQNRQAGENEHDSLLAVGILKELSMGKDDDEQSFSPTAMRALVDSMRYLMSKRDPWYKDMTREVLRTLGLLADKSQKIWQREKADNTLTNHLIASDVLPAIKELRKTYTQRRTGKDLTDKESSMKVLQALGHAGSADALKLAKGEDERQKTENYIYGFGEGRWLQ